MAATTIDELQVIITAQTAELNNQLRGVRGELGQLEKSYSMVAQVSKVAFVAAGAAVATGLGVAIKNTASYESSLSQLKQASGATSEQMEKMSEITRKLGQDSDLAGVSASDVASAMVELSKAGLSVNETMDATKGVLSLAKAGGIAFADAATIAASALNAFGLKGRDANKVADMLAAGANASQAELGDLAAGLQQSATVAKQFGLEMNETVTALSLFANNGIKGSDAGTSLKTMLIALAKPSKEASDAMKDIGFEAYNAEGKFVGLEEMSKRLKKATSGLTEEQKQNALATIFGTDAFRAAAVLADNAGNSYDNMSQSVGKVGAAQQAAAAQMGPMQRAWESFNNSLSELGLIVGETLSPYIVVATNNATQFVQAFAAGMPVLALLFTFMQENSTALITLSGALGGAIAAMLLYKATIVTISTVTTTYTAITVALSAVMALHAQGLGIVRAAWLALGIAMNASPIGVVTVALGALIGAVVALSLITNKQTAEERALNDQRDRSIRLADELKRSEDELKGAKDGVKDASLRQERAQKTYNDAVAQYGKKSLEAREAARQLEKANDGLKDANNRVREAVKSNTGAISEQKREMDTLSQKLQNFNGKTFTYYIQGVEHAVQKGSDGKNYITPTFDSGGFTGRGGKFEPAGIVHKGEYVIPKEFVDQATGLPKLFDNVRLPSFSVGGFVGSTQLRKMGDSSYARNIPVVLQLPDGAPLANFIIDTINNRAFMSNNSVIDF